MNFFWWRRVGSVAGVGWVGWVGDGWVREPCPGSSLEAPYMGEAGRGW